MTDGRSNTGLDRDRPETEDTQGGGAEQPHVAVASVVAPAGFVGVFDRRTTIEAQQAFGHAVKETGQRVQGLHEAAVRHASLLFDIPQGEAIEIVFDRHQGEQLVAVQRLGQDAGGACMETAPATRTDLLLDLQHPATTAYGHAIDHGASAQAVKTQGHAAVRTQIDRATTFRLVGLAGFQGTAAMAGMPGLAAAPAGLPFLQTVGLHGNLRRRRRGAKETLFGRPFLITQTRPQPRVLLLERIDAALLLQATTAKPMFVGQHGARDR